MSMLDLEKDEHFLDLLKTIMTKQGDKHNINFFRYIAPKMCFSNNGYAQVKTLFVLHTLKFLKLDQLFIILDNLDNDLQKELLDYIANKYNFTLSYKAETKETTPNNIKDLLLSYSTQNGNLISNFFSASLDGHIDEKEKAELLKQAYAFRSSLILFEKSLERLN